MFNENEFKFNIDNIKNDLAIEGMDISQNDIDMYRMYANNEVTMPDLIEMIKNEQDYFPKLTEAKDSSGKLKITKTSLKKALDNTIIVSNNIQCYNI